MKIFTLKYTDYKLDYRINLGDEIQSIAANRLLPQVDGQVSRERLNEVNKSCIVSLNGFFMDSNNWPPSNKVVPIPFAFHISRKYEKNICSPEGLAYLNQYAPIGCRDRGTVKILEKYGVAAYYSKCLTLTLDRRAQAPKAGKVYIVGVTESMQRVIPDELLKDAVFVNQSKVQLPLIPPEQKQQLAVSLLDTYSANASLVITSRIHCAMPCIALGIPVIFLFSTNKKSDYRVHIIDDLIGIHYVDDRLLFAKSARSYYRKKINWNPQPLDIENEKLEIKSRYQAALLKAQERFNKQFS